MKRGRLRAGVLLISQSGVSQNVLAVSGDIYIFCYICGSGSGGGALPL